MKYTDEQRKKFCGELAGRTIEEMWFEPSDGGYYVIKLVGFGEFCVRLMAELVGEAPAQGYNAARAERLERERVLAHVKTFVSKLAEKDERFNGPHQFPEAVELVRLIESGEVPR